MEIKDSNDRFAYLNYPNSKIKSGNDDKWLADILNVMLLSSPWLHSAAGHATLKLTHILSLTHAHSHTPTITITLTDALTHTHTHSLSLYIYIYIYLCECVCQCFIGQCQSLLICPLTGSTATATSYTGLQSFHSTLSNSVVMYHFSTIPC